MQQQRLFFRRLLVASACILNTSPLSSCSPMTSSVAVEAKRLKSSHIRIANRKRVEMFVGKRFHVPTRLRTAAPDVAAEWDYDKNEGHVYPEIIGVGSVKPAWWLCSDCGASFQMSVEKRVVRGFGCPNCDAAGSAQKLTSIVEPTDEAVAVGTPPVIPTGAHATTSSGRDDSTPDDDDLLEGERNAALRSKRPPAFTVRTRY